MQQPFNFLGLPKELRLMVYEALSPTVHQHVLAGPGPSGEPALVILVRQALPTALLRTCHLINDEAKPIFSKKYQEIASRPVRFVVDKRTGKQLVSTASPLIECFGLQSEAAMPAPQSLPSEPLDLPPHMQAVCSWNLDRAVDISTTYEDIPTFVRRAKLAIAGVQGISSAASRGFDIEMLLLGEIGGWHPWTMYEFLHYAYSIVGHSASNSPYYGTVEAVSYTVRANRELDTYGGTDEG